MVKLLSSFSRFKKAKVLLVGDFILDAYTTGNIDRISPEAPVPILHARQSENVPGGAGNVALNLQALGAEVVAVGRVGNDPAGRCLKALLQNSISISHHLFLQNNFVTPIKTRFISGSQQLIRVDQECKASLDQKIEEKVKGFLEKIISEVEVVAISDYGKGFLSNSLLKALIDLAKDRHIPVIVDPKGEDFSKYKGVTLIKPNAKEAYLASSLPQEASIEEVGKDLLKRFDSKMIMITRSAEGISLFCKEKQHRYFPTESRNIQDVTGAGDTVLSILAVAFASNLSVEEGIKLANIGAGIAIERMGCASISLGDIADKLLTSDHTNKIFDESHLFALEQALNGKKLKILGLDSSIGISSKLFDIIKKLSAQSVKERLMIYLVDSEPDPLFVSLLCSFHEIDFIVIQSESLTHLCKKTSPEEVFVFDGNTLKSKNHHGALLTQV